MCSKHGLCVSSQACATFSVTQPAQPAQPAKPLPGRPHASRSRVPRMLSGAGGSPVGGSFIDGAERAAMVFRHDAKQARDPGPLSLSLPLPPVLASPRQPLLHHDAKQARDPPLPLLLPALCCSSPTPHRRPSFFDQSTSPPSLPLSSPLLYPLTTPLLYSHAPSTHSPSLLLRSVHSPTTHTEPPRPWPCPCGLHGGLQTGRQLPHPLFSLAPSTHPP